MVLGAGTGVGDMGRAHLHKTEQGLTILYTSRNSADITGTIEIRDDGEVYINGKIPGTGEGHVITDKDDTELPHRSKLQFSGAIKVEDNEESDTTTVTVTGGGYITIDHEPTQSEADEYEPDSVVFVYDADNPHQYVPGAKNLLYPVTHTFVVKPLTATAIEIAGATEIQALQDGAVTEQYTAVIYDNNSNIMHNEKVTWALEGDYTDISIDSETGLLTVGSNAVNGNIVITATSVSYSQVTAKHTVAVNETEKDFAFVINGDSYIVDYRSGEALNFTIDWGDGTQSVVTDTAASQRTHTYPAMQEWTITIKNYVSGWIQFYHSSSTAQRAKLRRVLTPFPKSMSRKTFETCFYSCSQLTSIPENLFANSSNVTSFGSTFYGCQNLSNINIKLHPDVLARNTNYSYMFYVSRHTGGMEIERG